MPANSAILGRILLKFELVRDSIDVMVTRDVIRSPDIRTFESHSEVLTQFQHPEFRIKY